MEKLESIARALAAALAAGLNGPGSLRTTVTRYTIENQVYDAHGDPAPFDAFTGLTLLLMPLASGLAADETLCFELTVKASGEFAVAYSTDLPSMPPHIVFDEAYRYPDHPGPGMEKPAAGANDGRPTDPAILAEVQGLIAEFIRSRPATPHFGSGYSEAEILAVERRLGVRLPEDVRALYRTIHDDNGESGLLGGYNAAPLEKIAEWHESRSYDLDDGLFAYNPVVFEAEPRGHVKRLPRNDWWVTFAADDAMNYALLDLDPGPAGAYGQILSFGRDEWGLMVYVAPSVRHLMRGDSVERPSGGHQWTVDAGDAPLAAQVAAHPDAQAIQAVHLRQTDRVRLADLAGFPHLRSIRIHDARRAAGQVDLSITPGQPVEHVHIVAERFEPGLLATAPTIRYVTLAGNLEPASVAGLASLPGLVRLDLAEAEVCDVTSIVEFPGLRVLILNVRQWDELLGAGYEPRALAAAGLSGGGREGVAESVNWLNAVRGPGEPVRRLHTIGGSL